MTDSGITPLQQNGDDLLWQQLKTVPAFRALLRSVEARFYGAADLPPPILDVGCGDGHFAEAIFKQPITAGIDPWWSPLRKAQASQMYDLPLQAMGDFLPFGDHTFASAFSNSVLEHIADIQPVLDEVSRVMQPGAPFVLTVPSHYFTEFLAGAGLFERLGLEGMAGSYRTALNRISRHAHTDPPEVWAERLSNAGFTIERWQYYFSKEALRTLELGHAQGVPSAVLHALTGHWILGPWKNNLRRTEQWVRPYYEEEFPQQGAYLYFLARKSANEPLEAVLPLPRPYSLAELAPSTEMSAAFEGKTIGSEQQLDAESGAQPIETGETTSLSMQEEKEPTGHRLRLLVPGLLVILTLVFAFMGQSALRATPQQPAEGIRWFAFSAVGLLLLLWSGRSSDNSGERAWSMPEISAVPSHRWLYLPALLLAFGAYRLASSPSYLNPAIAIGIWLAAIALAAYALSQEDSQQEQTTHQADKDRTFTMRASVLLFLVALLVRIYDLANHPFILNGTEASIGLEAIRVLNGMQDNPFGTGWLTNPSLPFFLLAVPLRLLGPSAESLRLLSAVIGAVTVPILFVLGQRLYGRAVGLVAAILLAGSHFHIHFSRSGLTNAWDALVTLLALGLIAIAWPLDARQNRKIWLMAGTALGLSAYLYTSSHLLPIMLLALGLILLIFDNATIKKQWRHVLAMAALALVVALPQLLHYQASPGVFMERANALGILAGQSGWLAEEAARSSISQLQLLSEQFWQAALAFNATIDTSTSYGPFIPFLNFLFGLLAALGLILALVRLRQIRYSMLVVWVSVTVVFAGTLLMSPPISHHYIIAIPAVTLLAAVALNDLLSVFTGQVAAESETSISSIPGQATPVFFLIVLLIAVAISLYDVRFYFGTYRNEHHFGDRNTEIADSVAEYLNSLQGDWVAHFYGPPGMYVDFPTIPFLANDFVKGVNLFDVPEAGPPLSGHEMGNHSFLFLPERYNEIEPLRSTYPSGQEQIISGYYADPLFYVYEVRANP